MAKTKEQEKSVERYEWSPEIDRTVRETDLQVKTFRKVPDLVPWNEKKVR